MDEIVLHPWSPVCFISVEESINNTNQSVVEDVSKVCQRGTKGYLYNDVSEEEYVIKLTVLHVLLTIMLFGGVLTIISNSLVLFVGIRLRQKNLLPPCILSLAVTDLLNGCLGTPSAMAIYYFSKWCFTKKKDKKKHFERHSGPRS